jgi:hypothetical protein
MNKNTNNISISPIKFKNSSNDNNFLNNKSISAFENSLFFGRKDPSPGKVLDKSKISETYKNNTYRIYNERGLFSHNNDFFSDKEGLFIANNRDLIEEEAFIRSGERGFFLIRFL